MANRIDEGETAVDACPSEDHHNWRSCLKRMKCHQNPEGKWEMQPPKDPQGLPGGYQTNPCENCCIVVPDHSVDNCPHPEYGNFGVRFAIARGKECVVQVWASRRKYLNGITDLDALCPVCNWFVMQDIDGVVTYHNPKDCLKNC